VADSLTAVSKIALVVFMAGSLLNISGWISGML
jgi:hypothetical protein